MTGQNGFIKLYRKLLENSIWTQLVPAVGKVAIHFLMRANYKPSKWYDGTRTTEIPAGSFITSYQSIAKECNISVQQTRDAFLHLARTQFATYRRTHRWTMVTVPNWSTYQASQDDENTPENIPENTLKNMPENRQGTPDKEYKKRRSKETRASDDALGSGGPQNGVSSDPDELPFATNLDPQPFPPEEDHSAAKSEIRRAPRAAGGLRPDQETWWAEFWAEYWLKRGKKEARKAFAKAVKTEAIFRQVITAVRAQMPEMLQREPSKRPYAATWLNGERWEDELQPAAPSTGVVGYRDMDDWKKGIVQ